MKGLVWLWAWYTWFGEKRSTATPRLMCLHYVVFGFHGIDDSRITMPVTYCACLLKSWIVLFYALSKYFGYLLIWR